jgi:5-methylcytosine-specific restriction protein B
MEVKFDTKELDFYSPPLRGVWKAENEIDDPPAQEAIKESDVGLEVTDHVISPSKPRNVIFYGPPGTGKTYRMQQFFSDYTDQPADVDRVTWELGCSLGCRWPPLQSWGSRGSPIDQGQGFGARAKK